MCGRFLIEVEESELASIVAAAKLRLDASCAFGCGTRRRSRCDSTNFDKFLILGLQNIIQCCIMHST